jgi:hypothetical protein
VPAVRDAPAARGPHPGAPAVLTTQGNVTVLGNLYAAVVPVQAQCHGKFSRNPKGSFPPKPCTISFYPPRLVDLLETAKAQVHLSLFTAYPFLCSHMAVSGPCSEILFEVFALHERDSKEVEAGECGVNQ